MAKANNKINTSYRQTGYPVGDFLIKVKNAAFIDQRQVSYQYSKLVFEVANKLKELGFLEKVEKVDGEMTVALSYHKKEPILININLISRPGLRIYKSAQDLEEKKGPSVYILTTNKGILSHKQAIKQNIGGEVIAEIL